MQEHVPLPGFPWFVVGFVPLKPVLVENGVVVVAGHVVKKCRVGNPCVQGYLDCVPCRAVQTGQVWVWESG